MQFSRFARKISAARLSERFRSGFSLDLESLGVFRIGLAIAILVDLANRASDLELHYSERGMLPSSAWRLLGDGNAFQFSFHFASHHLSWQIFLFALAALAAVSVLLGYRTRISLLASWVLLLSLQSRNNVILQGGDVLLRVALFWSIFLPLGRRYSLDALPSSAQEKKKYFGVASIAYCLQIVYVYLFSALHKSGPEWIPDGTAVGYALSHDQFRAPLTEFMRAALGPLGWKHQALTYSVWTWELLGAFLLILPLKTSRVRTAAALGFMFMHLGFSLTLRVGIFPLVGIVALIPFISGDLIDKWVAGPLQKFVTVPASVPASVPVRKQSAPIQPRRYLWSSWISLATAAFVACSLVYVTLWNLGDLRSNKITWLKVPRNLTWFGRVTRLEQKWDMFSPSPAKVDLWIAIPGKYRDGRELDVLTGKTVNWDKPADFSEIYPRFRWRKYFYRLWSSNKLDYLLYFGKYLCRTRNANAEPGRVLDTFEIYVIKERTLPDLTEAPPERQRVWRHYCFEHLAPKNIRKI